MKPITIAVALDGVLAGLHPDGSSKIGDPIPGAAAFLVALKASFHVLIFTTRCRESQNLGRGVSAIVLKHKVWEWLTKHNMAFDEIWTGQGKPNYAALVDSRAIMCRPEENPEAFAMAAEMVGKLCPTEPIPIHEPQERRS